MKNSAILASVLLAACAVDVAPSKPTASSEQGLSDCPGCGTFEPSLSTYQQAAIAKHFDPLCEEWCAVQYENCADPNDPDWGCYPECIEKLKKALGGGCQ